MKIRRYNVNPNRLFLRTSNNGVSHNGFKRKPIGQWNDAGDKWTGKPTCEGCGGFFGADDKHMLRSVCWDRGTLELCEWRGERVVIDDEKICVSSYRVVAINENIPEELPGKFGVKVVKDGDEVVDGDFAVAFGGVEFTQSGGECWMHGRSRNNQSGGECLMYDHSRNTQLGGWCWMYGYSRNIKSGGRCWVYSRIAKLTEVAK